MSGWGAHHQEDAGAAWRALSGDSGPTPPAPQHVVQPLQGGWQQPWQDEMGQWHYPWAAQQVPQQPPYADAAQALVEPQPVWDVPRTPEAMPVESIPQPSGIVQPEQLAPVGPPRYLAPTRPVADPRQRTLAAVIVFVSLLIALWAILGFLSSLSGTLASIVAGNEKLKSQLGTANQGLHQLDTKIANLDEMSTNTVKLKKLLVGVDENMGGMLTGVDGIAAAMTEMEGSLGQLNGELGKVNDINKGMSGALAGIDAGLKDQASSVRAMRRDVQATGTALGTLPGRLNATNSRLAHVNNVVDIMGCKGITNNMEVEIGVGPLTTGSAQVYATVIPPGSWGTKPGGAPC